jgi:hypothetical protein
MTTSTRATRTREANSGEDRPCPAGPADAVDDRGYSAQRDRVKAGKRALTRPLVPSPVIPAGSAGLGRHPPDDGKPNPMSDSSRESSPPIELSDMPCGVVLLFRRPAGRLVPRRMPCRVKRCEWCGPRLRQQLARAWAHAMSGDQVYRLVVDESEWAKRRRRKDLQGTDLGHIPGPEGTRVVYTRAPVGSLCEDVPLALTSDFAAMPNDGRRHRLEGSWRQVLDDQVGEVVAKREPWECLGRVGRSLEQVAVIAANLGLLVGRGQDMLVLEKPDPVTESRLFALLRLQRGFHRRQVAA